MKYVVILGDGMADYPVPALGGKTPLMVARKPNVDGLARKGEVGLFKTVPDGMKPGSDVANLSVLGYNPKECYTGRSALEAASIGITLSQTDVTARANLVTLSDESDYSEKTMIDYSAGEITTQESKQLIEYLKRHLDTEDFILHAGVSYRHCLVMKNGRVDGTPTPPHDITGKKIKDYLPKGIMQDKYLQLMERSYQLLNAHPINVERVKQGKNPANSIWLWGEGTKPVIQNFKKRFGISGAIISAVDLLKGIGVLAGMKVIEVEGATGNYNTNFSGKAQACLNALKQGVDLVYVHVEAPDECGHHGDIKNKVYSIEQIDSKIVGKIIQGLNEMGEDYSILIAPDHPTPISTMTHCDTPVPYVIYRSNNPCGNGANGYDEEKAMRVNNYQPNGYKLMQKFIKG